MLEVQETNLSHLVKRKIIFKSALGRDMLVPVGYSVRHHLRIAFAWGISGIDVVDWLNGIILDAKSMRQWLPRDERPKKCRLLRLKMKMYLQKGPFQKDISSSNQHFSGDTEYLTEHLGWFWRLIDTYFLKFFFWRKQQQPLFFGRYNFGQRNCRILSSSEQTIFFVNIDRPVQV